MIYTNLYTIPIVAVLRYLWKYRKYIFGGQTTPVVGTSLGVLGMPEAGKTQFYKTLKGEEYLGTYEATGNDDYPEFDFLIKDKRIKVQAGRDIGGSERNIEHNYVNFISEKDIIVFVFDIKRFLEEEEYQRNVKARLKFLWRHLKEKCSKNNPNTPFPNYIKEHFIVFASHFDQLTESQKKQAINILHESVDGKEYGEMFHNNTYAVDLRNRNLLFKIFEKTHLFG